MRNVAPSIAAVAAAFTFAVGCATDEQVAVEEDGPDVPGLDDDFARAAKRTGVPADLLAAVSYVETQWQMVDGHEEHEGRPAGAGLFALWGDNLAAGVAAGIDEAAIASDPAASIAAGATRIAALAGDLGVEGDDLMAWLPVVEAFSQNPDEESRFGYGEDVLRVLAGGATVIAEDGTVVAAVPAHAEIPMPGTGIPRGTTDYPSSIWRPSPNFNSRGGVPVSLVVIHSCEGNYAGCWGWLKNSAAGASAHYVVKENGAEITQLVREASRAWHVAAAYECSRAGGAQCNRNGMSTNTFSVGIEHAGFASQSSWQNGLIEASSKLTCDIAKDHGVPRDRNHIVSHGQLQPWNRTHPGPNSPRNHYIDREK
jgi:hypothetical protein